VELLVDKGGRNRAASVNPEASIAVDVAGHGMNQNELWNSKAAGANSRLGESECDGGTDA